MVQSNFPCDFPLKDEAAEVKCGRTPTEMLALGMTAPDPAKGAGYAGDFLYGHFCEEHLPEMQRRLGQKK